MEYNKDFFIFGEPIETIFGKVRFLTYREYLTKQSQLSLMSMNSLHIYYYFKDIDKDISKEELEELKKLKEAPLLDIVKDIPVFKEAYQTIFSMVVDFKEDFDCSHIFEASDLFMSMRKLILDMNMMVEPLVSPNEEIQKGIERSRNFKRKKADNITFIDIVSSVAISISKSPTEVGNMTVIQVLSSYYRFSKFQNYNTTTLFATVSEKAEIEHWSSHIDLWEQETDGIDKDEHDKKYANIF